MTRHTIILLTIFIYLTACNNKANVDLPGFDEEKWKSDVNGCNGDRAAMEGKLAEVKDQLKGMTEEEIVEVLGNPDKHELYKRNQKFYIYNMENAPACADNDKKKTYTYFSIRYNATGLAKEVMIYRH